MKMIITITKREDNKVEFSLMTGKIECGHMTMYKGYFDQFIKALATGHADFNLEVIYE